MVYIAELGKEIDGNVFLEMWILIYIVRIVFVRRLHLLTV